jgi:tRNA G18 (ribose-2'-O)-methylase SpoU
MAQSDYDANKSDALLSSIRKASKDKNFSSLESLYGLKAVKEILDNPTPITRDIIMVNPTIRRVLESIPNNVKQDLIQNQNDAQAVAEFDEYFGIGAAQYIISRGG